MRTKATASTRRSTHSSARDHDFPRPHPQPAGAGGLRPGARLSAFPPAPAAGARSAGPAAHARRPSARFLDAANALSLSRLLLAALVWIRPAEGVYLVVLMGLAAMSDVLDGRLGRKLHGPRHGTANVGAWLDPLCDKVFTASVVAAVIVTCDPPALVVALVLLRDVLVAVLVPVFRLAAGRERFHGHDFRARVSGKATTVLQFAALLAVVFAPAWARALAWLCGLLGLSSVAERVVLAMRDERAGKARQA